MVAYSDFRGLGQYLYANFNPPGGTLVTEIKPDVGQANPLVEADYCLIPLHKWNRRKKDKFGKTRPFGKVPVQKNWRNIPCDNAGTLSRMGRGEGNTGVRLRAEDLVVDYDPRHDSGQWGVSDYV